MDTNDYKLEFFDVEPFLKVADILVAADEPLRALWVLNNLPGFYRDQTPYQVVNKRNKILSLMATPSYYQSADEVDGQVSDCDMYIDRSVRGKLIVMDIQNYNDQGITPHVIDYGPGPYWLALGLLKKGLKFTYSSVGLNVTAKRKAKEILGDIFLEEAPKDSKKIFVACEILEHLHHEDDIKSECERHCSDAEIVHISTPKYTFDKRMTRLNWETHGAIGHLRTYTPREFMLVIDKMFPEYNLEFTDGVVMHITGRLNKKLI